MPWSALFPLAEYSYPVLTQFGLVEGAATRVTMRGYAEDENGSAQMIVAKMAGRLKGQDMGTWKPGDNAELKGEIACQFYSLHINGIEVYYIDVPNMIRRIGGTDQLAHAARRPGHCRRLHPAGGCDRQPVTLY